MVGVFCRGVCGRENLVIRIMCHQANDQWDGLLSWMPLRPTIRIIAFDPHRGFMHPGIQSLDRTHITLLIPGWTVLLSHNDVEYVSY